MTRVSVSPKTLIATPLSDIGGEEVRERRRIEATDVAGDDRNLVLEAARYVYLPVILSFQLL